jgi:hypothetical protein
MSPTLAFIYLMSGAGGNKAVSSYAFLDTAS